MELNKKHLGIQIDEDLHYKLTYVVKYEGRILSGLIMFLVKKYIKAFEAEHGEIELPPNYKK